jgi:hypothetical protein
MSVPALNHHFVNRKQHLANLVGAEGTPSKAHGSEPLQSNGAAHRRYLRHRRFFAAQLFFLE